MKNTIKFLVVSTSLCASLVLPLTAMAVTCDANGRVAGSLIPCGYDCNNDGIVRNSSSAAPGSGREECSLNSLVILTQEVMNFLAYQIAAPLAALLFMYAGFLMLTNNGNESKITQAKAIFGAVFFGLVIVMAAWLVVTFILDFFLGGTGPFRVFV